MKIRAFAAVFCFFVSWQCSASEPFPVGNETYAATGMLSDDHAIEKLVAIQGEVVATAPGPQGKPLLHLKLDANHSIWVGSLVVLSSDQVKIGQMIRVMGYLASTSDIGPEITSATSDKTFVLAMCTFNLSTKIALFVPAAQKSCEEWQSGMPPEAIAGAP